jgi:hypothetical protein
MGELADAITAAAPDLDPAGQRLFIAVYRLLAAGHPVTTAALARAAGLPEAAAADALGRWPGVFTDRHGRVTGFWGWRSASCHRRTDSRPAAGSCTRGAPGTRCSCPPGSGRTRASPPPAPPPAT